MSTYEEDGGVWNKHSNWAPCFHWPEPTEEKPMPHRRLVRVLITDTREDTPVSDEMILHDSGEFVTDQSDQTLLYAADPKALVVHYNADRKLAPFEDLCLGDLSMQVITIAEF